VALAWNRKHFILNKRNNSNKKMSKVHDFIIKSETGKWFIDPVKENLMFFVSLTHHRQGTINSKFLTKNMISKYRVQRIHITAANTKTNKQAKIILANLSTCHTIPISQFSPSNSSPLLSSEKCMIL
jgi:dethiobiotin synthetase